MLNNAARKLIECSKERIKESFKKWYSLGNQSKNRSQTIKLFQKMMYKTKIGRVLEAWNKWKNLPIKRQNKKF